MPKIGVGIGASTWCGGVVCLYLVVEFNQALHPSLVAVALVGVECEYVDFFVVEHANGAQVHKGLKASHARAAYGYYKESVVHEFVFIVSRICV